MGSTFCTPKEDPSIKDFTDLLVIKDGTTVKAKMSGAALRFNPNPPTEEFLARAAQTIPCRVQMLSGYIEAQIRTDETQSPPADIPQAAADGTQSPPANDATQCPTTAEETQKPSTDVPAFCLPPVSESDKAGGACTNGLLSTLANQGDITYGALLIKMREVLKERKYTQIPQLSSAQNVKLNNEKFTIWNPEGEVGGPHKALLIGINYVGQTEGVLSGSVNDVKMMRDYIQSQGFKTENISILADDEELSSVPPTGAEIVKAIGSLVNGAKAGDSLFFHYSGHGGQVKDQTGDELDGMDETLIPVDYQTNGQITDDTIFQLLVGKLPAGVSLTCVFDCCRSGTIMDLPFIFSATEESCAALEQGDDVQMSENPGFNFDTATKLIMSVGKGVLNQVLKSQKKGQAGGGVIGENMISALGDVAGSLSK